MKSRRNRKDFIDYDGVIFDLKCAKTDASRTSYSSVDIKNKSINYKEKISKFESLLKHKPPEADLPPKATLIKISGVLEDFSVMKVMGYFTDREYEPEYFSKQEKQNQYGGLLLAILGNAVGASVTTQSKERMNDPADFVQGKINGIAFQGWLGMTNARKGDFVEMIVAPKGDYYEVYALANPQTRVLSITPRCRQGINAHLKEGAKLGHIFVGICFVFFAVPFLIMLILTDKKFTFENYFWMFFFFVVFDLFFYFKGKSLALKKVKPTIILAEMIFSTLGFENSSAVDLEKITKNKLKELNEEKLYDRKDADGRPLPGKHAGTEYFYYY
ncbi:putative type VI secretion system effector [Acerihabitans sp. TG2]|uniref:putative type VI secretion system effector n=1 Tax=Acerihabitans sp. TG2 TaxID=3096008 RepID=UPI002B23ED62|nr:putative type VI secretion system effector [Acerihabitans sp. TG2]MEA9393585.1 putative type VI secretion system effector [Acerihabitans sp. TG2]